ncbi:hypothetical protein [Halothiobacillus sp. DCM-1]|uniref:hypothetical protein n=1 Tax=Halothiobacillus sp. DCM-1 TaxID=3112558 RepID=UPI0032436112
MSTEQRTSKRSTDQFTTKAGASILFVIAGGFLFVAFNAFTTGCTSLTGKSQGSGVLHCMPDSSYWTATISSLVLGCALVVASWKLLRRAMKGSERVSAER